MTKKILLCGDSFATTDPHYPGLHFSEKISAVVKDCEIINMSRGGSSNLLIEMQVRQGLTLAPDYVIVLFTNENRLEYAMSDSDFYSDQANSHGQRGGFHPSDNILNFNDRQYLTSACWHYTANGAPSYDGVHHMIDVTKMTHRYQSQDLTIIKQYFSMVSILNLLKNKNINMCFSLGGMHNISVHPSTPYHELTTKILPSHFLPNELEQHMTQAVKLNLWDHADPSSSAPYFHVADDAIQTAFARECIDKLNLLT